MEKEGVLNSILLLFNSRKDIIIGVTWTSVLASILAGNGFPPLYETFLSTFATMFIISSVYFYNDIVDRDMDAHSTQEKKKGRPIAHGRVSISFSQSFVMVTGVLGLLFGWMVNNYVFAIGLTYFVVVLLYSYPKTRFKEVFIVKNLVTSLLFPTAFLIGASGVHNTIKPSILLTASTYYVLTVLVLPAIADMLDYREDLDFNVKTIGNTLSWGQNLMLFNCGVVLLLIGNILASYWYSVSPYVPLVTSFFVVYLMALSYSLRDENGETAAYKLRPISFAVLLLNPLILALSVFI